MKIYHHCKKWASVSTASRNSFLKTAVSVGDLRELQERVEGKVRDKEKGKDLLINSLYGLSVQDLFRGHGLKGEKMMFWRKCFLEKAPAEAFMTPGRDFESGSMPAWSASGTGARLHKKQRGHF